MLRGCPPTTSTFEAGLGLLSACCCTAILSHYLQMVRTPLYKSAEHYLNWMPALLPAPLLPLLPTSPRHSAPTSLAAPLHSPLTMLSCHHPSYSCCFIPCPTFPHHTFPHIMHRSCPPTSPSLQLPAGVPGQMEGDTCGSQDPDGHQGECLSTCCRFCLRAVQLQAAAWLLTLRSGALLW